MFELTIDELKQQNQYFYASNYASDNAIREDAEILAKRVKAFDEKPDMRCGDFLKLKDGTLRRIAHHWGDGVQPSSGNGDNGSFYLGRGYCSYSGGLDSLIPIEQFKPTGETMMGRVWIFHRDFWGAGRGVYAKTPFRVFEEI